MNTYNTVAIVEKGVENLAYDGQHLEWSPFTTVMVGFSNSTEKFNTESKRTLVVSTLYRIRMRDQLTEGLLLDNYRFRVGTLVLYPRTYFRYNGKDWEAEFQDVRDLEI